VTETHLHLEVSNFSDILHDGAVVNHPDLSSNLRDQSHVVRDQHHAAFELVDSFGKTIDTLHVCERGSRDGEQEDSTKMVSWLIKQEDVR
jgi:hypothetical protein